MSIQYVVARVALRRACQLPRQISASRVAGLAYHSYSLPSNGNPATNARQPLNDDIPEITITKPEPLPRVHETRPPSSQNASPPQPVQAQSPPPPKPNDGDIQKAKAARPRPKLRARKAAMKLTPAAVEQLRAMLDQPDPKLIKVGVKNRGCSGLAYHLEYVDKAGAFDETVEQDGVKVLIDSKALFSIIGSEMDWAEDKLSQKFVFTNPNIKESCGCGESFMV